MSAGTDTRDEDRMIAAEYTLGLLDEAEALAFEARLVAEPELRAAYARWAEEFATMTDEVAPVAPPARVWSEIQGRLFAEARAARPRWRLRERLGLGALLAAAAVMLVLWLGPHLGLIQGQGPQLRAELTGTGGAVILAADYDPDTRRLSLMREIAPPQPGRDYELWLIEGDTPPVSLGVLPAPERALIVVPEDLAERMTRATLAISDEPAGGSPTGQATGPVLGAAPLVTGS